MRIIKQYFPAALLYLALAAVLFYPLSLSPGKYYFNGYFSGGLYWDQYILNRYIFEKHEFPYHIDDLRYPIGGYHVLAGWNLLLLSSLLMPLAGLYAAFNISALLYFVCGAFFMYLLALKLSGSRLAAFAAGLIYGFSPFALSILYNGHIEKIIYSLIPLYAFLCINYFETFRIRYALLSGLVFLLIFSSEGYFGIVTGGFILLYSAHKLIAGRFSRKTVAASLIICAVTAISALPYYKYMGVLKEQGYSEIIKMPALPSMQVRLGYDNPYSSSHISLKHLFITDRPTLKKMASDPGFNGVYHIYYLGIINLLILCAGVLLKVRGKLLFWFLLLAAFLVLSCGYVYYFGGYPVFIGNLPLTTPLFFLARNIPAFKYFSNSYRAIIMVYLSTAVIAAYVLAHLLNKTGKKAGFLIILAVIAAVAADYSFASPLGLKTNISEFRVPAAYGAIGADREDYAIIEYPFIFQDGMFEVKMSDYNLYQTIHRKKAPYALFNDQSLPVRKIPLISDLIMLYSGYQVHPEAAAVRLSNFQFEKNNYRYLVLLEKVFRDKTVLEKTIAYLDAAGYQKYRYGSDRITVYLLDPEKRGRLGKL